MVNKGPSILLRWYLPLFNFLAKKRLKNKDIDPREIHTHMAVMVSTGVLMWSYAFLALFTVRSPVPGIVGIVCSSVHLLSPLLFRLSNSSFFASNVLLSAGIVHQGTFSYYSGGFNSNIIIWFGILPMLGGVICGKRGVVTWLLCTFVVSLAFFILELSGHRFPNLITPLGRVWAQALLVFGWIFISTSVVTVYAGFRSYSEVLLKEQGQKIDDLFRVLFHDLANPLGRMAIGLSIARRQLPPGDPNRGFEIAKQASDSMMEITQNIRKMYAVSKGKANVDLSLTPLNSAVEYILKVYAPELEKKKIKIHYDFDRNAKLSLLVEPVSFNNQVLGNIISNAIKFSNPGSEINLITNRAGQNFCTIAVQDQGIGIPEALIKQLFDLNKKTSRPGTNGETGTGFGMHIMKSFVEMYGGELVIESSEGAVSGTTVKLKLKGEWA